MNQLHVLLTRFNLRADEFLKDKNNIYTLTDEWYEDRFRLFESICYPSIKNQYRSEFIWFIFFDVLTPDKFMARIKKYSCESPRISCIFADGMAQFSKKYHAAIDSVITKDVAQLVTTRLDNDDALSRDFTELVFRYAKNRGPGAAVLDFVDGCSLSVEDGKAIVRRKRMEFGPFLTLIEPVENYRTVFSEVHVNWKNAKRVDVLQVKDRIVWLQTVHNRNIGNRVRGFDYLCAPSVLGRFCINIGHYSINDLGVPKIVDYCRVFLMVSLRFLALRILPAPLLEKIRRK